MHSITQPQSDEPTGFLKALHNILESSLAANEKLALISILSHWSRKNPKPFPATARLARHMSSHHRTVYRTIKSLTDQGALAVDRTLGRSNAYDLTAAFDGLLPTSVTGDTPDTECTGTPDKLYTGTPDTECTLRDQVLIDQEKKSEREAPPVSPSATKPEKQRSTKPQATPVPDDTIATASDYFAAGSERGLTEAEVTKEMISLVNKSKDKNRTSHDWHAAKLAWLDDAAAYKKRTSNPTSPAPASNVVQLESEYMTFRASAAKLGPDYEEEYIAEIAKRRGTPAAVYATLKNKHTSRSKLAANG